MWLLFKSSLFKIKKAIGRFLSVVLIVALGTGFFAGLREASPDMIHTIDKYFDDSNLMDFKVTSTMGLNDDDIKSLEELDNVDKVIPTYSLDVMSKGKAIRVHAIEDDVNEVVLKDGRMPKKSSECLAEDGKYKIGETINFELDNLDDYMNISSCKVTGLITTPLYLAKEKGIANIGNGKLDSYVYVLKDDFVMEYYTEAYLLAKGSKDEQAYSDEYNEMTEKLDSELEELKPIRETKRYEEILQEAMDEINKAEAEINNELDSARAELEAGKKTLDDNYNELMDSKAKLDSALSDLNKQERDGLSQIASGRSQITESRNQILNTLSGFGLDESNLVSYIDNLNSQIQNCEENCEVLSTQYQSLVQLQNGLNELNSKEDELDKNESTLKKEISDGRDEINKNYKSVNDGLAQVQSGYDEYNAGVLELETRENEANQKIAEEREKLDLIEKPVWYLLDRTSNNGYTNFYDDASKVEAISNVFPIFFILVAGLICLNTLGRLIEEERSEIGILTSLGYSNFKITLGYIFYCLIATIIGVSVGLSVGYYLIPSVIYGIYNSNYVVPDLIIGAKPVSYTAILLCTSVLMIGVAIYVCLRELREKPAILLRPKAPKKGKKVLLERWKFVWNKLSFTWKITIRNIFRYKKRVFMTIIGVAGCTALLLTGFGLRDGINSIGDLQYGKILKYDVLVSLSENTEDISDDLQSVLDENDITSPTLINQEAFTFEANNKTNDVYMLAFKDKDKINDYISLNDYETGKKLSLPNYGAIITEKMASLLEVSKGDSIKIRDTDNNLHVIYVAGICENYAMHYIYMSSEYYEKVFDSDDYNMIMGNLSSDKYDDIATNLLKEDNINAVNYTNDNIETYNSIIDGLNSIVYLIIGAALLLAIVVLYNLLIINMNERKREIATFKVLGFKNKEISSYVYRETIILTLIGIAVGLVLGVMLDQYVIITAETDEIMFLRTISVWSFVFATVLTIVSSIIVELFTYNYLRKVDMIESLKALDQ